MTASRPVQCPVPGAWAMLAEVVSQVLASHRAAPWTP